MSYKSRKLWHLPKIGNDPIPGSASSNSAFFCSCICFETWTVFSRSIWSHTTKIIRLWIGQMSRKVLKKQSSHLMMPNVVEISGSDWNLAHKSRCSHLSCYYELSSRATKCHTMLSSLALHSWPSMIHRGQK